MARAPDGDHIRFQCDFSGDHEPMDGDWQGNPATIYAFALNELLNDGGMLHK